jgi:hypothetical protein
MGFTGQLHAPGHFTPVKKAGATFTGWAGPKTSLAAGFKSVISSALPETNL